MLLNFSLSDVVNLGKLFLRSYQQFQLVERICPVDIIPNRLI